VSSAVRKIAQPESMRTQIYESLRLRLQGSEFTTDDRLVDTEIAKEYGTSRMPAREALLALMSQGFLKQTSRGFVIPVLTPQDIRDIFEIRRLVEPDAAAQAARSMTDANIARLAAARQMAMDAGRSGDAKALMLANMEFRSVWIEAVPNPRLRSLIESFSDHAQAVRIATLKEVDSRAVVLDGIDQLMKGFAGRDGDTVKARLAAFIEAAEAIYFRGLGSENAPAVAQSRP
jgi:DNA-binding GntR family transcriptional regulator